MALRHDVMDSTFFPADPPPTEEYQAKTDLATEYFNTFSQICENYRESDVRPSSDNLRLTSDSLRLSSEILDGREYAPELASRLYDERQEYVNTDFSEKFLKDEQVFQFGQPDASALLRHRTRRRINEERGLQPPPATSQESGVSW